MIDNLNIYLVIREQVWSLAKKDIEDMCCLLDWELETMCEGQKRYYDQYLTAVNVRDTYCMLTYKEVIQLHDELLEHLKG